MSGEVPTKIETRSLQTFSVKPAELMQHNLVIASLPPGAFIGPNFDPAYYKPIYVVDVMDAQGGTRLMPYDGHRRIGLAIRDGVTEIDALNVTAQFVKGGKKALTPEEHTKLMRELHDGKTDDRRIALQVLTEWRMNVGDEIDSRCSALAALSYLSFTTLRDKSPSEITTIVTTPGNKKHPGSLPFDAAKDELRFVAKGISNMAGSIGTVNISYQDMMRHALWTTTEMTKHQDPKIKEAGDRQIRGLFNHQEIQKKIVEDGEATPEKNRQDLEEVYKDALSKLDTEKPASIRDIRAIHTILTDKGLSYRFTLKALRPPSGETFYEYYNTVKREVNCVLLTEAYFRIFGALPSPTETELLTQLGGTTLLSLENTGDREKIRGIVNTARGRMHQVAPGSEPVLREVRGAAEPVVIVDEIAPVEVTDVVLGEAVQLLGDTLDRFTGDPSQPTLAALKVLYEKIGTIPGVKVDAEIPPAESEDSGMVQFIRTRAREVLGDALETQALSYVHKRVGGGVTKTGKSALYIHEAKIIPNIQTKGKFSPDSAEVKYACAAVYLTHATNRLEDKQHGFLEAASVESVVANITSQMADFAQTHEIPSEMQLLLKGFLLISSDKRAAFFNNFELQTAGSSDALERLYRQNPFLKDKLEPKAEDKRGDAPPDLSWEERRAMFYDPVTDGVNGWFGTKFQNGAPLDLEDRTKVTFMIDDALTTLFPDSKNIILAQIKAVNEQVGLDVIQETIAERVARIAHARDWHKGTPDFIFLAGLVAKRFISKINSPEKALMEQELNQYRTSHMLRHRSEPYAALLEFLAYTDQGSAAYDRAIHELQRGTDPLSIVKPFIDNHDWLVVRRGYPERIRVQAEAQREFVEYKLSTALATMLH